MWKFTTIKSRTWRWSCPCSPTGSSLGMARKMESHDFRYCFLQTTFADRASVNNILHHVLFTVIASIYQQDHGDQLFWLCSENSGLQLNPLFFLSKISFHITQAISPWYFLLELQFHVCLLSFILITRGKKLGTPTFNYIEFLIFWLYTKNSAFPIAGHLPKYWLLSVNSS